MKNMVFASVYTKLDTFIERTAVYVYQLIALFLAHKPNNIKEFSYNFPYFNMFVNPTFLKLILFFVFRIC